jgi:hypothetical protein
MALIISCPSCGRQLCLPDEFQGQEAKCPSCTTQFLANTSAATLEAPTDQFATNPPPAPLLVQQPAEKTAGCSDADWSEATRWSEPAFDGVPSEQPYHRSAAAREAVSGPATFLLLSSGTAIGLAAMLMIGNVVKGMKVAGDEDGRAGRAQVDPMIQMVSGVAGAGLGVVYYGVIFASALQMRNLRSWGFSLAGSIMAMMPCTLCCVLTLPFGLWSLIVLSKEEVKSAFR